MSLAQHLTATEGVDRAELQDEDVPFWNPFTPLLQPQPDQNDVNDSDQHPSLTAEDADDFLDDEDAQSKAAAGTWRRLSFDAFAPPDANAQAPVDPTPHVAAYKISTPRRIAQVAFSIVACWFAAGTVFGFASLKPILIAEGVYRDQCSVDEIAAFADDGYVEPCPEQDLRLNLFFIAASITCNTSSLVAGSVLDRYGRRLCYTMSSVFLAIGSVLMGYAFSIPEFDGYLVANIFLALGGTFLFVPSYQMANAFPKYSGIIVAIITGAFDASAAIYLFYRWAWEATNGAFTPSRFFFLYLIVPVCILIGEYTLMPAGAYHTTPELEQKIEKAQNPARDIHDSDDDLSEGELHRVRSIRSERRRDEIDRIEEIFGNAEEREERAQQVEEQHVASGIWGVLHGLPAHRQMMTPWFILILLLTVLQMLRMNYFIATIRAQYRHMLGSDDPAEAINHFFDAALPIGGVAATPFIGLLLNHMSVGFMTAVLTVYIALIGVLNCLPYEWAGYTTVVFFVLFRPLYYSAVSDYATKVFGFATFGRIYGMLTCISGIINFSQSGIDALTHGPLHGDPTPVNIVFAVLGSAIGLILTIYVYSQARKYEVEQSKPEMSDPQRLPLIRETSAEYGTVPGRDASQLISPV